MKRLDVTPQTLHHPLALWVLKTLLLVLGLSALAPGFSMMLDPSGNGVGFPEGSLKGSPFTNYLIPGFLLTVFVGFLSLAAWYALWKRPVSASLQRINPFSGRHWAWTAALISGVSLVVWIAVQIMMVPYFFLQPVMFGWGAFIVLLCYAPGVRAFYEEP